MVVSSSEESTLFALSLAALNLARTGGFPLMSLIQEKAGGREHVPVMC